MPLLKEDEMVGPGPKAPSAPEEQREPTDQWLLQQFQEGSQDAATEIYLRYAHRLRALAQKQCSPLLARCVEADDIVQSVFRSFFRRAQSGLYDVPSDGELWRLFLVITLNKVRAKGEFHRAAKRDARLVQALPAEALGRLQQDPDASRFLQMVIDEAVERLPEHHRQIVRLRLEGCEVAEIAEQTQRAKRTVERVLQMFRALLKELLDEDA
jgi:RNA polymerase sigma-70 factor (ECF subfamily)